MYASADWRPTATIAHLRQRAQILATIRTFFAQRHVWEVETPLLNTSTATDPHIHSLKVNTAAAPPLYLQTSPEFAMKRLLAAGSGSIYQITKAFRSEEQGRLHSEEFSLLEWYRIEFDHHQLMDEMDALLHQVLGTAPAERLSYLQVFLHYLNIDPLRASAQQLKECANAHGLKIAATPNDDVDFWRQLLISHLIEPHLGKTRPVFIVDFPASQAALAKIRPDDPLVAERFEVYFQGIELANGYHELCDSYEQQQRFLADNKRRQQLQLAPIPSDACLLAALEHGFPACAGVALGIDRLVMLALGVKSIGEVTSFNNR